ncbi:MAG: helix-turn-helix domain-containing protein [Planctomycetes bacterium]|nr:helix-turn-helix domain-containing protein [Planctomycetota bacterium]
MSKKYVVTLTDAQRQTLLARRAEPLTVRQRNRVDILLCAADGDTDAEIADDLGIATNTVARIRQRFVADGLDAAVSEKTRGGAPPKLDGKQEALLIALACSPAPEGQTCWTIRRLTERVVGLEIAHPVSRETVRRLLKKTSSSRGSSSPGACPRGSAASSSGRGKRS